jgi:hypothetical protein
MKHASYHALLIDELGNFFLHLGGKLKKIGTTVRTLPSQVAEPLLYLYPAGHFESCCG